MDYQNYITMSEVGFCLRNKQGKRTTRAWAHKLRLKGEFPSVVMLGGVYLVDPADVTAYIQRQQARRANGIHNREAASYSSGHLFQNSGGS